MSQRRKERIRALLKAIETGDPEGISVVDEARYIQHNPQTHEGSEGLAALFARLATTNPRVALPRVFSDGDYVFAHTEYDFATRRIGFEVFRFEGDHAVEHWDNIQPRRGPNPAGRSMVDGPTEATDRAATEVHRATVQGFLAELVAGRAEAVDTYVAADLRQHHPELLDGRQALRGWLATVRLQRVHRVLAEGSFVLAVCEGHLGEVHTSFYFLFRLAGGRIVEQWSTVEKVPPPSEWKNDNGKF